MTTKWLSLGLLALAIALLLFGIIRLIQVMPAHGQVKPLPEYSVNNATPGECVLTSEDRERLREIMLGSFDHAFEAYATQLYMAWLREYSTFPDPERALKGMINNRHAWLKTRAFGRAYNPPLCKDK